MMSVISFTKVDKNIIEDADMGGPMLIIIIFGLLLLTWGKVQFGFIYGFSFTGCIGIFSLLRVMIKWD
jgi:protein YIPF5/7